MKRYMKNFMFFVLSSIILTLVFSSAVESSNSVISMSENILLTDKVVEKEVILYNFFNETLEFNLKLHTAPFHSELLEKSVYISPNEFKKVKYMVYPLKDSLEQVYTGTLEVSTLNNTFKENFTINQAFNKTCDVLVDFSVENKDANIYNINLFFKNNSDKNQNIKILENSEVFLKEDFFTVSKNSDYLYQSLITFEDKNFTINYTCNNINKNLEINLDDKNNFGKITGYFSLNNFKDFFSSLFFKILLVVVLVILVLSFSTRYIRYINKEK